MSDYKTVQHLELVVDNTRRIKNPGGQKASLTTRMKNGFMKWLSEPMAPNSEPSKLDRYFTRSAPYLITGSLCIAVGSLFYALETVAEKETTEKKAQRLEQDLALMKEHSRLDAKCRSAIQSQPLKRHWHTVAISPEMPSGSVLCRTFEPKGKMSHFLSGENNQYIPL